MLTQRVFVFAVTLSLCGHKSQMTHWETKLALAFKSQTQSVEFQPKGINNNRRVVIIKRMRVNYKCRRPIASLWSSVWVFNWTDHWYRSLAMHSTSHLFSIGLSRFSDSERISNQIRSRKQNQNVRTSVDIYMQEANEFSSTHWFYNLLSFTKSKHMHINISVSFDQPSNAACLQPSTPQTNDKTEKRFSTFIGKLNWQDCWDSISVLCSDG